MPAAPLPIQDFDTLREVASIGCGHAVTALGRFTGRTAEMDVCDARPLREASDLRELLAPAGEAVFAVGVALEGFLGGHLLLALPERDARRLAALLGQAAAGGAWDRLSESALLEAGNIAGSSFVSAIGELAGVKLMLSVPRLARGSGPECLGELLGSDPARVALTTRFTLRARDPVHGLIVVLPDPARLGDLLAAVPGP